MKFLLLVLKVVNLFLTAILMTGLLILILLFGTVLYNMQHSGSVPTTCEYYQEC